VLFVLAIFAIGESTLFVTSCAIMCISRTHEKKAHSKWEAKRQERNGGPARTVLNRNGGGGAAYASDAEVLDSFDPDAEWGASKIQANWRQRQSTRGMAPEERQYNPEERQYNPSYSAANPPPPPSESDFALPPPSEPPGPGFRACAPAPTRPRSFLDSDSGPPFVLVFQTCPSWVIN